jgi:hypothetical protein
LTRTTPKVVGSVSTDVQEMVASSPVAKVEELVGEVTRMAEAIKGARARREVRVNFILTLEVSYYGGLGGGRKASGRTRGPAL